MMSKDQSLRYEQCECAGTKVGCSKCNGNRIVSIPKLYDGIDPSLQFLTPRGKIIFEHLSNMRQFIDCNSKKIEDYD